MMRHYMKKIILLACLLFVFSLHAKKGVVLEAEPGETIEPPWLTGPLLAPSGATIPAGHYNIEPYIYVIANTGTYDSNWHAQSSPTFWGNLFQPSCSFGITSWLDFQFNPSVYYNHTEGASKWGWGDMPTGFDFQLYLSGNTPAKWVTGLKLSLVEVIPMGKYRNLDPNKLGTDAIGGGSWQTWAGLTWGNLFYLGNQRFFNIRLATRYTIPAPVHVKNLNTYGGGPGTDGTVYPAQNFKTDIGMELTLTKNWVFAMDILGIWAGKVRFKGKTVEPNTAPPSTQFSLAPAIEYNWNTNLGIIFGPWFTVAGRNATQFAGGVFAVNYYN